MGRFCARGQMMGVFSWEVIILLKNEVGANDSDSSPPELYNQDKFRESDAERRSPPRRSLTPRNTPCHSGVQLAWSQRGITRMQRRTPHTHSKKNVAHAQQTNRCG